MHTVAAQVLWAGKGQTQTTVCSPFGEQHLRSPGIVLHIARPPTPPSQSSPRGQVARDRMCPHPQRRSRGDKISAHCSRIPEADVAR